MVVAISPFKLFPLFMGERGSHKGNNSLQILWIGPNLGMGMGVLCLQSENGNYIALASMLAWGIICNATGHATTGRVS